jgi:hypothetical protein
MRPTFSVASFPLLSILGFFSLAFAVAPAEARTVFAEKQVLTRDKIVEVNLWLVDTTSSPQDRAWRCDSAAAEPFRMSACSVRPYARASGPRDEYLYWAFLNLAPASERGDLAPRSSDQEAFFDGLDHPLLAMKRRGDSCTYLVLFRDSYAPLAAGRVACADLDGALRAVDLDLAGRQNLFPKLRSDRGNKRVIASYALSWDFPRDYDVGMEASASLAFGMSADHTEGEGPFAQEVTTFNFKDLTDQEIMPLSLRAFVLYRGIVGLRVGYSYSAFALESDAESEIRNDLASQGGTLQDWKIARHDYTAELLLGRTIESSRTRFGIHGIVGFAWVDFRETVTINDRKYYNDGLFADVKGGLFGFGGDVQLGRSMLLGLEACLLVKDFEIRNADRQPDGTGNELQFRLRLAWFKRKLLSPQ